MSTDDKPRSEQILGHKPPEHTYSPGTTLRSGLEKFLVEVKQAQETTAILATLAGTREAAHDASTLIRSYEAFRVDVRALLDHTALARHEARDKLVAEVREGWPTHATGRTHEPSGRILDIPPVRDGGATAQLIEFAVDTCIAKGVGHE